MGVGGYLGRGEWSNDYDVALSSTVPRFCCALVALFSGSTVPGMSCSQGGLLLKFYQLPYKIE